MHWSIYYSVIVGSVITNMRSMNAVIPPDKSVPAGKTAEGVWKCHSMGSGEKVKKATGLFHY